MWAGQGKETTVINGGGRPIRLLVTGAAFRTDTFMQRILGGGVAPRTGRPSQGRQHAMGKGVTVRRHKAGQWMVRMTAHAIRIRQTLMEQGHWCAVRKRGSRDRAQPDVTQGVTRFATRLDRALHRRVAGKTIGGKACMSRDQRARTQHWVRIGKGPGCAKPRPARQCLCRV